MTDVQRYRRMMTGKIHRVRVTGADLNYVGSITVDADLLDAADILPGQEVDVVDVTNGARLTTYVIPAERGSGSVCINGAAAHLVHEGDVVILMTYSLLAEDFARTYTPHVVFVDEENRPLALSNDPGQVPAGNSAGVGGAELKSSGVNFDEYRQSNGKN